MLTALPLSAVLITSAKKTKILVKRGLTLKLKLPSYLLLSFTHLEMASKKICSMNLSGAMIRLTLAFCALLLAFSKMGVRASFSR